MRSSFLLIIILLLPCIAFAESDLRGIWEVTSPAANTNLEGPGGSGANGSFVTAPADGKIPYTEAARATVQRFAKNAAELDPVNSCFQPGVPRAAYIPEPFQIFQSAGRIHIVYQHVHAYRVIFTDGRDHYDEGIEFYMGDSRAHWEGDTLVVDVTNFKPETWFDKAGHFHGNQLHVVERYTRTGDDSMTYEATIEDPEVFTQSWTIQLPLKRHTEPNFQLLEHECERDKSGAFYHPTQF